MYRNEDVCQFSYIFLHRPGSRAFNNRPPWHSWVFGDDEWKEQLDAAITTDFIEAFNRYVREVDTTAMKANESDNSMVYSTLNKIWLVRRVHLDSQVATLYQKHDITRRDSRNIEPLSKKYGFNNKFRNEYEKRKNYSNMRGKDTVSKAQAKYNGQGRVE